MEHFREVALQNIPIYRHSRVGGNLPRQWIPAFAGMTMGYSYLLLPLELHKPQHGQPDGFVSYYQMNQKNIQIILIFGYI